MKEIIFKISHNVWFQLYQIFIVGQSIEIMRNYWLSKAKIVKEARQTEEQ